MGLTTEQRLFARAAWTCPECGATSPRADWREGEVGCEDCGSHPAWICPACGEVLDASFQEGAIERASRKVAGEPEPGPSPRIPGTLNLGVADVHFAAVVPEDRRIKYVRWAASAATVEMHGSLLLEATKVGRRIVELGLLPASAIHVEVRGREILGS